MINTIMSGKRKSRVWKFLAQKKAGIMERMKEGILKVNCSEEIIDGVGCVG